MADATGCAGVDIPGVSLVLEELAARIEAADLLIGSGRAESARPELDHARRLLCSLRCTTSFDARRPGGSVRTGELSPAELRVLALLDSYRSLQAIADELFISRNTVKTHVRSIYIKLGATSRTEAVRLARAGRWSDPVRPATARGVTKARR